MPLSPEPSSRDNLESPCLAPPPQQSLLHPIPYTLRSALRCSTCLTLLPLSLQ